MHRDNEMIAVWLIFTLQWFSSENIKDIVAALQTLNSESEQNSAINWEGRGA